MPALAQGLGLARTLAPPMPQQLHIPDLEAAINWPARPQHDPRRVIAAGSALQALAEAYGRVDASVKRRDAWRSTLGRPGRLARLGPATPDSCIAICSTAQRPAVQGWTVAVLTRCSTGLRSTLLRSGAVWRRITPGSLGLAVQPLR